MKSIILIKRLFVRFFIAASLITTTSPVFSMHKQAPKVHRLAPLKTLELRKQTAIETKLREIMNDPTDEMRGLAKEILGLIKENVGNINQADQLGFTALGIARDRGSIKLIMLLLDHGATYDETLLTRVKERFPDDLPDFLEKLLERNFSFPLEMALRTCDIEIISTLLHLGADEAIIKGEAGAVGMKRAIKSGSETFGIFLMHHGVNMLTPIYRYENMDVHNYKITLAHLAAEYGCTKIMQEFLATFNGNINNIVTIFDETLLHYAVTNQHTDADKVAAMIELLKKNGAEDSRHRYGETPTDWAQRKLRPLRVIHALQNSSSTRVSPDQVRETPRATLPSSPISTIPTDGTLSLLRIHQKPALAHEEIELGAIFNSKLKLRK